MVPREEALPWHEDLEHAPGVLFAFYAVDDGVQQRGNQQAGGGQEDMNGRGNIFAEMVNHGQASHGDGQNQDCQDTGQAALQSLETLPLGWNPRNCLTNPNI